MANSRTAHQARTAPADRKAARRATPTTEATDGANTADRADGANTGDGAPCCPPLTSPGLTSEDAATMAAMFKALGEPVRVLLFSRVASHPDGEVCVCDLGDLGVAQPTVSHHLKKLRDAGLLASERRGTWVYYRVPPGVLAAMGAMVAAR